MKTFIKENVGRDNHNQSDTKPRTYTGAPYHGPLMPAQRSGHEAKSIKMTLLFLQASEWCRESYAH